MLPMIIGKMPNTSFSGCHFFPSKKSNTPISAIAGIPFANKKRQINSTANMDTQAAARNTYFIPISLILLITQSNLSLYTHRLFTSLIIQFSVDMTIRPGAVRQRPAVWLANETQFKASHSVISPIKMSLTCSLVRSSVGLSLFTTTAIPS